MCGPHRRMPQVLSTITTMDYVQYSVKILVSLNTISGKYCYNCKGGRPRHETSRRGSIPQAVSAVATPTHDKSTLRIGNVSIPQAVSAVATFLITKGIFYRIVKVSILQAVSAVATQKIKSS